MLCVIARGKVPKQSKNSKHGANLDCHYRQGGLADGVERQNGQNIWQS